MSRAHTDITHGNGPKLFYFRRMVNYSAACAGARMELHGTRRAAHGMRAHAWSARAAAWASGDLGKSVASGLRRLEISHEEEGGVSYGPPPPGFVFITGVTCCLSSPPQVLRVSWIEL